MRIEDLPESYQRQARRQIGPPPSRVAVPPANVEPNPRDAAPPPAPPKVTHEEVVLHIHSVRKRLADIDGICGKWAIDSLVIEGVLQDDSPRFVKAVEFSQEQGEPERTVIEVIANKPGQGRPKQENAS